MISPPLSRMSAAGGWYCCWCCKGGGEAREEVKRVSYLAAPMVVVNLAQCLLPVLSNMMVGHLGELSLASAAMATSLANVTGFSLLLGMSGALETLCGQAYGAQQYQKVGIYTYRATFSLLVTCLPITFLWISMGKILQLMGQDPLISLEAGKYVLWMIPGLFAIAICQPLMKFLQSQSLILPMFLTSVLTLCIHIPLCWVLVFKSGLGNAGGALSISISYWLNVIMLGMYIKFSPSCKKTRVPLSDDAFRGINEFLSLALPSAGMLCLEWWSFELVILLSGLLSNPKLETSVLSICLSSIQLLYSLPYGLGSAGSTRVSNELGAGNPEGAKLAASVVMLLTVVEAALVSGTFIACRHVFGYAYSDEKEVIDYVAQLAPLVAIVTVTDALQAALSGIARGCGWQELGAYINLGAFYVVGIPIAVVLAFPFHMRGRGLWCGVLFGAGTQSTILALITALTNWEKQANLARERFCNERLPLLNESN